MHALINPVAIATALLLNSVKRGQAVSMDNPPLCSSPLPRPLPRCGGSCRSLPGPGERPRWRAGARPGGRKGRAGSKSLPSGDGAAGGLLLAPAASSLQPPRKPIVGADLGGRLGSAAPCHQSAIWGRDGGAGDNEAGRREADVPGDGGGWAPSAG